jgi:hypothetical protein
VSPRSLSAILLAHEAPDFAEVQDTWFKRQSSGDSVCHKFVILGRFDQLIISLADDPAALLPAASDIANARAATSSSYIGRVIAPDQFHPTEWAADHPILGLCSARFARRILAATGNFHFLDEFLSQRLKDKNIRHAVVSATGWEDALVVFFAKDFNAIAHAAGELRSMRFSDLPFADQVDVTDGFTHPCLTTCTLPAFCCQWRKDWEAKDTANLLSRINHEAPLNWAVRLELHPGHWGGCAADLRQRCLQQGIPVPVFRPTFGQTDLRISDSGGPDATHGGLLRFLLDVVFKVGETRTVIRSAETHLHPVLLEYQEDPCAGAEVDQKPRLVESRTNRITGLTEDMRSKLIHAAVPPHTLAVLNEVLSRIQGISDDPMHGEEFEALQSLHRAFADAVHRLPNSMFESASRELQMDISDWQGLVERCLADRFRGSYPAGDSLMMRMSSYQGAHHRFLVVMDQFAQRSFDLARHSIHAVESTVRLPEAALATFIGNSPSAYATSHTISTLGCGFTDVPATLICRLRDAHLVAHETGHHVIRAFFTALTGHGISFYISDPVQGLGNDGRQMLAGHGVHPGEINELVTIWKSSSVLREIRELMADFFSYCICFPENLKGHREATRRTLGGFFEHGSQPYLRSIQIEARLRSAALEAMLSSMVDASSAFKADSERILELVQKESGRVLDFERLRKRRDDIQRALRSLQILYAIPAFRALIQGFRTCGQAESFHDEDPTHSLLKDMRGFLCRAETPSLEENFAFLDSLRFTLLRSRGSKTLSSPP